MTERSLVMIGARFEAHAASESTWWTIVSDIGSFVLAEDAAGRRRSFGRSFAAGRIAASTTSV